MWHCCIRFNIFISLKLMSTSHRPAATAARMLAVLTTGVLLVQCSMPPQQAWRSIQTQGLLPYLSSARQPSPPFRAGSSYAQRYSTLPRRPHYGSSGLSGFVPNSYLGTLSTPAGGTRYVPRTRSSLPSLASKPDVKIPVEEPTHLRTTPAERKTPAVSPTPKADDNEPAALSTDALPYGSAVPGRMNMVTSPFAGKTQLVDVSGMSAGQTVKCPYTGKLFRVPPTQQATNTVEPRLEPSVEPPKTSDKPQPEEKKP